MLNTGHSALHRTPALGHNAGQQHRACSLHNWTRFVTHGHGYVNRADQQRARAAPTDTELRERLAETSGVVTDQAVPEGHKGLHGFLYGEGGAEAHDSGSQYNFREVL